MKGNCVLDGLYIGCLSDVGKIVGTSQDDLRWTVISVLSTTGLIELTKEQVRKTTAPPNCLEPPYVIHVIWELKDRVKAPFLCEELIRVLDAIEGSLDDGRQVLVHCCQGKSRSGAVVAAYMLHKHIHLTLQDTMNHIRRVRPMVDPNMGFIAALKAIERSDGDVRLAVKSWNNRT